MLGFAMFWDLNSFHLVRRLLSHPGPIAAAAIDDLYGDIATASKVDFFDAAYSSCLRIGFSYGM